MIYFCKALTKQLARQLYANISSSSTTRNNQYDQIRVPDVSNQADESNREENIMSEDEPDGVEFCDTEFNAEENQTVHEFLQCSVKDALHILYVFCVRHNLNWTAMEDLAALVNTILNNNALPTSKYLFKKRFAYNNEMAQSIHLKCEHCKFYLGKKEFFGDSEIVCPNCMCRTSSSIKYKKNFFVTIPIRPQIVSTLKRNIRNLTINKTTCDGVISDVQDAAYSAQLRKKMGPQRFITLTVSTDGGAVQKSAKHKSLWPIQCFINEITLSKRFKRQNIMCAAFDFGETPDMCVFMKPFIEEINAINANGGVAVKICGKEEKFLVVVSLVTADSVAKCSVLNKTQFNSHFGCPYCMHYGNVPIGSTQIKYSFQGNTADRLHDDVKNSMLQAATNAKAVNGYYGVSPLLALDTPFDLVWSVAIDKMHSLDLGVVKKMFDIWLNPKNRQKE